MLTEASFSPVIIGILNVTPDSFSDGGMYVNPTIAVERAMQMREQGADFIEIGGESTRPGSKPITLDEEWNRIEPILRLIVNKVPTALDTYKAEIASRALDLGAQLINDVSALRADSKMASVVSRFQAKVVLMHSKENGERPHVGPTEKKYCDPVVEISNFLRERIDYATSEGITPERIIVDPGMGKFVSSDPEVSWEILRRIGDFRQLGYPLLLGASRKGFMSKLLPDDISSEHEDVFGPSFAMRFSDPISALIALHATLSGVSYIRTHNVILTREFLKSWKKLQLQ